MESFADKVKRLRKEKGVPLRIVAAFIDIDQAILSKIENGKLIARRENVTGLAKYYDVSEKDLLTAWLSDKIVYEVENEEVAFDALKLAEEKIEYLKTPQISKEKTIEIIREFLARDGRVSKAWIFGSFARGDYKGDSDVDLMVVYSEKASGTLLDYADIKFNLENLINRKVDLVEDGYVKPFAAKSIEHDKILIYG